MNQYSNKYTENDYIRKCDDLKLIYKGFTKTKRATMINFICPLHESVGIQSKDWSHFKTYSKGCPYCTGRYKTTSEIMSKVKDPNVEIISEYKGCEKPIQCRCKQCGNEWTTIPKVLTTNGSGCPICGQQKRAKSRTKSHDDFVRELRIINSDIDVIGTYVGSHKLVKCNCKICGNNWDAYPSNLLNKSAACPNCNISNSEREMVQILREFGLNIEQQKTIKVNGFRNALRIDAFDNDNNIAFEYNGEQHYRPVDFAGKGDEWASEEFTKTTKRDKAKVEYFKTHKISYIFVPYWERENMRDFLVDKIKELNIDIKIE